MGVPWICKKPFACSPTRLYVATNITSWFSVKNSAEPHVAVCDEPFRHHSVPIKLSQWPAKNLSCVLIGCKTHSAIESVGKYGQLPVNLRMLRHIQGPSFSRRDTDVRVKEDRWQASNISSRPIIQDAIWDYIHKRGVPPVWKNRVLLYNWRRELMSFKFHDHS